MKVLVFTAFLSFFSCSILEKKQSITEVTLNDDVLIVQADGPTQTIKSGSKIELKENLLLESAGKVSVLLVPIDSGDKTISVKLKDLNSEKMNTVVGSNLNQALSKLLFQINDIQQLLLENKGPMAVARIEELQQKYQDLEYLDFLKVSAHVVSGNRTRAKTLLERALKKYPENKKGRELYNNLFKNKGI